VVVLAGGSALGAYRWQHRAVTSPSVPAEAAARSQRTLLVQVRGANGDAQASVLLASDRRARQAVMLLVPDRVVAQVPGSGTAPFGQAVGRPGGAALSRSTLADLIGVDVDASWVLDQPTFARLVDSVGGIDVDVDTDIVVAPKGGRPVVEVPKGAGRRLSGAQALAVLAYRGPGEEEVQALPRVQHVMAALLRRLPAAGAFGRFAAGLGAGSELSDSATATGVLDGVRTDDAADLTSYQILPVLPIDGGGAPVYRIDASALTTLVHESLAASRLPGRTATGNRVLVLNQAGGVGLGQKVRDRIVPRGFVFVDSRNQTPFGRRQTVVVVFDATPQTRARAARLAAALGLPAAPIQISARAQNIADLLVVLGRDFRA